ncbi:MAG: AMP-binding protein, partial [Deltaproteobacteria bacterium]|nr:AMP-binding protein [Deltaproteobacteria bacterium]
MKKTGRFPPGESGEIIVRGPECFVGYLNPELNEMYFDDDGWFHTGDLGRRDEEGYVEVTGRKKDIIIRGGENLSAKEIEDVLYTHRAVHQAAVVGMPDPVMQEKLCAYLVLKPGRSIGPDELIVFLKEKDIARQKFPERLEIVDAMPMTAAGKIQKYVLRKDIEKKILPEQEVKMESMRDKAAIVGVGYTTQGKVPGRSSISFHVEAARNAFEDAGLKAGDVDGLLIQPPMGDPSVTAVLVAQHLGIRARFLAAQDAFGASAACQAQHAAWAVAHGYADCVVCSYGENARSGISEYGTALNGGLEYGMFGAASVYALAARRGMHEFGTGPETWSQIAVAQRKWANLNPVASMYNK